MNENYKAGLLDEHYSLIWESMSELERWWAASNKSLGPAPTLAPAAAHPRVALVIVASQRHPALAR